MLASLNLSGIKSHFIFVFYYVLISIIDNEIYDEGAQLITSNISSNTSLTHLNLSRMKSHLFAFYFDMFQSHLNHIGNNIGDKGAQSIASFSTNTPLTYLDLSRMKSLFFFCYVLISIIDNEISNEGAQPIALISSNTLTYLDLSRMTYRKFVFYFVAY